MLPFRNAAKFLISHFQAPIMGVAQRSELARNGMLKAERLLRTTPVPGEFAVYSKRTSFATDKAENMLGYRPRFPMADALPLTAAWLHHHGFIQNGSN
jgi:nucleoside-diphosphate-sugar epimerase